MFWHPHQTPGPGRSRRARLEFDHLEQRLVLNAGTLLRPLSDAALFPLAIQQFGPAPVDLNSVEVIGANEDLLAPRSWLEAVCADLEQTAGTLTALVIQEMRGEIDRRLAENPPRANDVLEQARREVSNQVIGEVLERVQLDASRRADLRQVLESFFATEANASPRSEQGLGIGDLGWLAAPSRMLSENQPFFLKADPPLEDLAQSLLAPTKSGLDRVWSVLFLETEENDPAGQEAKPPTGENETPQPTPGPQEPPFAPAAPLPADPEALPMAVAPDPAPLPPRKARNIAPAPPARIRGWIREIVPDLEETPRRQGTAAPSFLLAFALGVGMGRPACRGHSQGTRRQNRGREPYRTKRSRGLLPRKK